MNFNNDQNSKEQVVVDERNIAANSESLSDMLSTHKGGVIEGNTTDSNNLSMHLADEFYENTATMSQFAR